MELEIENPDRQQKQCVNQDEKGGKPISGLELEIIDADNTFELSLEDPTLNSKPTATCEKTILHLENIQIQKNRAQFRPEPACRIKPANEKGFFREREHYNRTEVPLENRKKSNRNIRTFQYALLVALATFITAFLLFQVYSKSDFNKKLHNKSQHVPKKNEKVIEKEQVLKNESPKNPIKQPRSKSVVIYSWTNEKGQKMYSNVGFPEDGKYTDPNIEWQ